MIASKTRGVAVALIGAAALLFGAGCNLGVQLTSPTGPVPPGSSLPFTLGLTNNSQCPVGQPRGIFLPFVPAQEFAPTGNPVIDNIFLALLNTACTGAPVQFPAGITCSVVDQQLVCELTDPPLTTGQVPSGDVPVRAGDTTLANCHVEGSKITCTMESQLDNASLPPMIPLLCVPLGGNIALCGANQLAPGASRTTSFELHAPVAPGVYRSLFLGVALEPGICHDGTDSGDPCSEDGDCAGGGDCATGICINDMTQALGNGCDDSTDCAAGETCVLCRQDLSQGFALPIACAQIIVAQQAPAQSPWGMATAALALLGLGYFGLQRLKRSQG